METVKKITGPLSASQVVGYVVESTPEPAPSLTVPIHRGQVVIAMDRKRARRLYDTLSDSALPIDNTLVQARLREALGL